ncbi:Metallothiol transferase FosB [Legionella parisiensis]|uniref:Metallothiol transferase FosB n=1 Tax=Legionella parisiensis TaxID=45071 RepID=A0A1E5JVR3_9GAMM|nr:VOC family protein [Legionella parisiensis]OEH48565.1 Metallothiol transferase FosB [Legionella parisiensis]
MMEKAKLIGINHIALEVGDVEKALEFYRKIFNFTLRGKDNNHAFIDLGDQFIALMKSTTPIKIKYDILALWSMIVLKLKNW